MKTKLILKLSMLFFIAINVCCSKDSTPDSINIFKAKIGGHLIDFEGAGVSFFGENLYVSKCKNRKKISLMFPDSTGTYAFDQISLRYVLGECTDLLATHIEYEAIDGSLTLTESNGEKIRGTFYFTGENYDGELRVITDGIFEIEH